MNEESFHRDGKIHWRKLIMEGLGIAVCVGIAGIIFYLWILDNEVAQEIKQIEGSIPAEYVPPIQTATTTIDDVSNWKTYRNEVYGFEVRYPNDWIVEPYELEDLPWYSLKNNRSVFTVYPMGGFPFEGDWPIQQIQSSVIVAGVQAMREDFIYSNGVFSIITFPEKTIRDFRIETTVDPNRLDKNILDQILSTFRFIE